MANLSNINNKFLVTTGGAVGVGVTSPGSKLSIGGTTGSYDSGIGFQPTGTGARIYRTFIATDGSFRFDDVTAGYLTRLTINSSGNVGIGTTGPVHLLQVKSSYDDFITKIENDLGSEGGNGLWVDTRWNVANNVPFKVTSNSGNSPMMIIKGSGAVGIGITDPSAKLEVKENLYVSHPNAEEITFRLDNYGTTGTDAGSLLRMFNQAGTTVVNIDSRGGSSRDTYFNQGGNVGIGTDDPQARLHVEKDSTSEPLGLFKTTAGDASVRIEGAGGESYVEIANTSTSGSTTNSWGIGMNDNTSLSFGWGANNTLNKSTYLTILDGGNVGIGMTGPSSKLQVGGTTSFYNGGPTDGAVNPGQVESISTGFNLAGSASIDISTISVTTDKWKVLLTGGFANNYEGGGLVSPSLEIEVDYNSPTVAIGSTGITFSRNATTGKLQVTNTNASYRATFVGTIKVINYPQSVLPVVSKVILGRVGIGTISPDYKLQVEGTASKIFNVTNTSTYSRMLLTGASGTGGDLIFSEASTGTAQFGIYSNGAQATSTLGIYPNDGSSPAILVKQNGNVGIGTTSPGATLDVNGDVNTTGNNANTLEFSTFFGSGTTVIATLNGSFENGTTAVASIEYVGLYAYAGSDLVQGILMAATRRSINNTAWTNVNDRTVDVSGSTGKEPTLVWDNGILKLTVGTSVQISCRIRITYHGSGTGLTRNHPA